MSKPDLIPVADLDRPRANPMVWEGEEQAQGVFLAGTADDEALALLGTPPMTLPRQPRLPEDFAPGEVLRDWLSRLQDAIAIAARGEGAQRLPPLAELDNVSRQAVIEILGEGEVCGSVTLDDVVYRVRESVLTGVWHVTGAGGRDWVEVGTVPGIVTRAADSLGPANYPVPVAFGDVMNAPAVLGEIRDHATHWDGGDNHVINFTLLPMSPGDHEMLISVLGRADLALNSGGFGDCRIMATQFRHVWAVQFVNAMGHTILDTVEIGGVPGAACAAREDFEDSAERLADILEAYLS